MRNIIRLLPDSLANQIAAGEVVQRPASVVKELLENAVDAGSQQVQLIVKDGGRTLIQVIDDGTGMSETDARLSFERHATSKISHVDDLFQLRTMGFRGEALASIAAVAHVELRTRTAHDELGVLLIIEGSQIVRQEASSTAKGANFLVKNLFYNVPARRNFLKSVSVELKHITDEFQRVALANPHIGFSFYHNDSELYNLKKGNLASRITGVLGKVYQERLVTCGEETTLVRLQGFIGRPEYAKKTRGEQFFFANNRFIKHPYLHNAVMTAYENLLPADSFPLYVLFLDIDPQKIDVNVHPTKTEVKFEDERVVYAITQAAVRQALGTHHVTPAIDFGYDVNFITGRTPLTYNPDDEIFAKKDKSNLRNWEKLYGGEDLPFGAGFIDEDVDSDIPSPKTLTLSSGANEKPNFGKPFGNTENTESQGLTFQMHRRYVVSQVKSGMMLIDQQAAHERILYEKFLASLNRQNGNSQQLLFPQTLFLSTTDFTLLSDIESEIKALGFSYELSSKNTITIKGVPPEMINQSEKVQELIESLIEQYKTQKATRNFQQKEYMAKLMLRYTVMRKNTALDALEMKALIDQLFACQNPNYTPDGRKTFVLLDFDNLEKIFG